MMGATGIQDVQHTDELPSLVSFFTQNDVFVVPESILRDIAKGSLRTFILQSRNIQHLQQIWKCLLHTFSATNLPGSHNTAICNVVSGYLESALKSEYEELNQFVRSEATWMVVFDIYLDRYVTGRPKPMKQVLATLIMILSKHMDASTAESVRSQIVKVTVSTIILFEPRSRLKASLVSLEALVRKEVINVVDLFLLTQEWLWANHASWIPLLGEHCINLKIPLDSLVDEQQRKELPSWNLRLYAARIFCLVLLLNTHNRDISLPAGMLFSQICYRLKSVAATHEFPYYQEENPFWVAPLKYISLMNLSCLEPIANHVLSPLFKMERKDFFFFVTSLPLDSLSSNSYTRASNEEYSLLFAILELGKELGLVHEKEALASLTPAVAESSVALQTEDFKQFLVHADENIRIPAFSLLITDPATAKPFSPVALRVLMDTLPFMHAETDSHTRSRLLGILRKLVIRLRGSSNVVRAAADGQFQAQDDHPDQKDTAPGDTKEFLYWYINFLESELQPTASYQRHILALKVLMLLLQSGVDNRVDPVHLAKIGQEQEIWRFSIDAIKHRLFRAVADLLVDPYDDVRETSMMILRLFPRSFLQNTLDSSGSSPYSQLVAALSRAEEMAGHTSRADHSDTVGRLYRLLFDLAGADGGKGESGRGSSEWSASGIVDTLLENLEQSISCSSEAFHATLHNTPLQGHISALRYIAGTPNFHEVVSSPDDEVPAWSSFMERMLSICWSVWFGVHDVLCVDSPEREHEDLDEDLAGPKDVLSFSWRALRESSLLLNAILQNPTFAPSGSEDGIGHQTLMRVGQLSFEQLAELRHRGAFSTVSQTFASCCQRCVQSDDSEAQGLPATWYKETVRIIYDQGSSLTRRSAGLPAIITAIASSQPKGNLFRDMMEELQGIARTSPMDAVDTPDIELPQVHALNCLKDIFTNTMLAASTEPYIMSSLNISADCLGSKIWAIRNCGLMLFRALINRMSRPTPETRRGIFAMPGSDSNHSVPFEKYHGLIPLLSGLLDPAIPSTHKREPETSGEWELSILTERVFPALELIGNKAPSRPSQENEILKKLALCQLSNPVWGIRDHAARTYVTLIKRTELLQTAQELSSPELASQSPNQFHGSLLCIKYLLRKLWQSPSGYWRNNLDAVMATVENTFRDCYSSQLAPYTQACFFEILADALHASVSCNQKEDMLLRCQSMSQTFEFESLLEKLLASRPGSSASRSLSLLVRFLAFDVVVLNLLQKEAPEALAQLIEATSTTDQDAAPWILNRLHQALRSCTDAQFYAIQLYASVIGLTPSPRLRTEAISNLAESLESVYERHQQLPGELKFLRDWAKGKSFTAEESCEALWDRERSNASMHLEGCLFPLRIQSAVSLEESAQERTSLEKYTLILSAALAEETEFTTRKAAISSIKCFILGLQVTDIFFLYSPALTDVYFLLYDMLNDDDEELREMAADIASKCFSVEILTPRLPLATTVWMASFLSRTFPKSQGLFEGALVRFMGNRRDKRLFNPVSDHLAAFQKESTILFVEEKQNLYIDDVRETEIWSSVLAKLDYSNFTTELRQEFSSWVSEGLVALCDELRKGQAKGLLGWMSRPDSFALSMRLIHGAKVVLLTNGLGCSDLALSVIRRTLQEFLDICGDSEIYEPWITGVKSALDPEDASYANVLQANFSAVGIGLAMRQA